MSLSQSPTEEPLYTFTPQGGSFNNKNSAARSGRLETPMNTEQQTQQQDDTVQKTKRFPFFKIFIGILGLIAVLAVAIGAEKHISSIIKDVNIKKDNLSTEEVTFFDVTPLDTQIMAVIASDGTCRLAFNECLSCHYNDGVKATFTDDTERKIVKCTNCGCETAYDDLGILREDCTPIPILNDYIVIDDHTIMIPKEFLTDCKTMFDVIRSGKNNYATVYDTYDYMNMEITEAGDAPVSYDRDGEIFVPAKPIRTDDLYNRAESITKLYNGYVDGVSVNAPADVIESFTQTYKEFSALCEELNTTELAPERTVEISEEFDRIEKIIRETGSKYYTD